MNAMEKAIDLLLCIGILFLIPLLYFDSQRRTLQAIFVGQTAEMFLNRVSVEGEITVHAITELERMLHELGNVQYEIQREYYLYEPGDRDKVLETVHRMGTEDIVEELEMNGGVWLRKGDTIRLLLYCGEVPVMYSTSIRTGGEFR